MRPNKSEELFLSMGYNRFYDLFKEIVKDDFWKNKDSYRFCKVSNIFAVYSELLTYEPFKYVLEAIKQQRPPMESEIGGPLFKFIRNILIHFPLFETWNDVWVSKELVNWQREGHTIDSFLNKYAGQKEVKYRFWEADKKRMTYISIKFHQKYGEDKIYLRDMITEKDGIKFSLIMMKQILNTQVESVIEKT
ncbi:MAG: hypothetical protein MJA29_00310 [Candidatus Omnitrophica bacterium]|nr:hypothetical protein [Candidatus Omnitrophota bacterium]